MPQSRSSLIQQSKLLSPSSTSTSSSSSSSSIYSNRANLPLTPVSTDIYTADRPFYWNSIDVSCRSTIIKLSPTSYFVHSPVNLDASLLQSFNTLVSQSPPSTSNPTKVYVFTPNYEHLKYAPSWFHHSQSLPPASPLSYIFTGSHGTSPLLPTVRPFHELPLGHAPSSPLPAPLDWDTDALRPMHVSCETNPFTNKVFFSETVFFHAPSKSLITTDLFWNYPSTGAVNGQLKKQLGYEGEEDFGSWELAPDAEVPKKSRAWKFGMDKIFTPFYMNLMVSDKEKMREIVSQILEWEPEILIPAHGDVVRGKELCRLTLERHFKKFI